MEYSFLCFAEYIFTGTLQYFRAQMKSDNKWRLTGYGSVFTGRVTGFKIPYPF